MKASTLLLGLLGALASHAAAAATTTTTLYPHVPLLLWSKRPVFHSREAYSNAVLDEVDVAAALNVARNHETAQDDYRLLNHDDVELDTSEALCVFLRANIGAEDLKDAAFVQRAIKTSKSSVVVPHTTRSKPLRSALLTEGNAKAPVVNIHKLNDWLSSDAAKQLFSNGRTDLLVVDVPDTIPTQDVDGLIKAATEALLDASKQRVDFALTGDAVDPIVKTSSRRLATTPTDVKKSTLVCEVDYKLGFSGGKAFCFSHYVHMTPDVLAALTFGFIFVFLTYVGISVLMAIQTPTRFPHHGPPKGKEF
ncbi:hypothetical protein ATCC90586_010159 [Pythium insidiosum]|nr:hypothetical protein ATCC90586_010159 [Pythium insidiosum]